MKLEVHLWYIVYWNVYLSIDHIMTIILVIVEQLINSTLIWLLGGDAAHQYVFTIYYIGISFYVFGTNHEK